VKAFFYVTLPQIAPGIIVASMFGFMISFSELVITLFICASNMTTFPVRVYSSMVTEGLNPMVLAYSTIIIVVVLVVSVLAEKFAHWTRYF
jgi:ABC-type spermidine/putrescine transport system permease subunit II